MWLGLAGLLLLSTSSVFQQMTKTLPVSLGTSIVSQYRRLLYCVKVTRSIYRCSRWALGKIGSGESQILKELFLLELRSWLIKRFRLGDLTVYPKRCVLTYYQGDRRFQVCFPKKRGPRNIVAVYTLLENRNVTEKVFEAMGPSHNFHNIQTTPKLLGFPDGLQVRYRNKVTVYFLGDDIIQTTP